MSFKRYSHCPSCDNFLIIVPNHFKTCPVCELQKENSLDTYMKKNARSESQTVS